MKKKEQNHSIDSLIMEIKAISYVLNIKIIDLYCKLDKSFHVFKQFNIHISYLCDEIPFKSNLIEDIWLMHQYEAMACLLEQYSHICDRQKNAGYYFQTAALYAKKRQYYLNQYNTEHQPQVSSQQPQLQTVDENYIHYEGQYLGQPTLYYQISSNPLTNTFNIKDYNNKDLIMKSIVKEENEIDHHTHIIDLLTKAYECFKRLKNGSAKRIILHIAYQMAREYYNNHNYTMAKKFFDRITNSYRHEKWYTILSTILIYSLKCAEHLFLWSDVVHYCIELSAYNSNCIHQDKIKYFHQIFKALQVDNLLISKIFEIPNSCQLISCQSNFTNISKIIYFNQSFTFNLDIQTSFPIDIEFKSIDIRFNISSYRILIQSNSEINQVKDMIYKDLTMKYIANQYSSKSFHIPMKANIPTKELKADYILFTLEKDQRSILFKYTFNHDQHDVHTLIPCTSVCIAADRPKADILIGQISPCLIGEKYPIRILITSNGDLIKNGKLIIQSNSNEIQWLSSINQDINRSSSTYSLELPYTIGGIDNDHTEYATTLWFYTNKIDTYTITTDLIYYNDRNISLTYESSFQIIVKPIFEIKFLTFGAKGINNANKKVIPLHDRFVIHATITNVAPHDLILYNTTTDLNSNISTNQVATLLKSNGEYSHIISHSLAQKSLGQSLGNLILTWNRHIIGTNDDVYHDLNEDNNPIHAIRTKSIFRNQTLAKDKTIKKKNATNTTSTLLSTIIIFMLMNFNLHLYLMKPKLNYQYLILMNH